MAFPFFWRKTGKQVIGEKKLSKPALATSKNISESAKSTIDIPKGFIKDIGEPHPSDMNLLEDIYKTVPFVQGAINKTVDAIVGSDISIKSDNQLLKEECDKLLNKINFDLYLRNVAKDLMIFSNSFTEIVTDEIKDKEGNILKEASRIVELKTLSPKFMYVRRDKFGYITGYTQSRQRGDKTLFSVKEIVHYKYNVIGDCAYGYSIITPLIKIIENKLNMEQSMMTLMDRKSNAPLHIKLGNPDEPATPEDINSYANDLYYIKDKTEWVTDHRVEINTVDLSSKIMNFAPYNEHIENQMVYGLETPIVLLGRGNIPEGLATVQLEAWSRRIDSIRLSIENVIEEDLFKPLKKISGLKGTLEIDWDPQSEDDKWKEIEKITYLMAIVSEPLRAELEKKISKLLDIKITSPPIYPITPPALQPQQKKPIIQPPKNIPPTPLNVTKPQLNKVTLKKKSEAVMQHDCRETQSEIEGEDNTYIDTEPLENGEDMTISEWTMRNPSPIIDRIGSFLSKYKFKDIDVSKKDKEKLRSVMFQGMNKNVTLSTLRNMISKSLGVDRARAERIARTESVRATSEALLEDFADKDINNVRWVVIGDGRLCEQCAPMQGKVFHTEKARGQIPRHPSCRCTWSAVIK